MGLPYYVHPPERCSLAAGGGISAPLEVASQPESRLRSLHPARSPGMRMRARSPLRNVPEWPSHSDLIPRSVPMEKNIENWDFNKMNWLHYDGQWRF